VFAIGALIAWTTIPRHDNATAPTTQSAPAKESSR
jgi:hypothetical protein